MEELKAVTASCVFVGSLNPAILTPEWVVKYNILPGGASQTQLTGGLMGPLPPLYSLSGITWTVTYSRLVVTRAAAGANPGEFAARVAERLEHTPINGVGNNFQYVPPEDKRRALAKVLRSTLADALPAPPYGYLAQEVILKLASPSSAVVDVSCFAEASEAKMVSFNFHRECSSAIEAAKAARQFLEDEEASAQLIKRLLLLAGRKRRMS